MMLSLLTAESLEHSVTSVSAAFGAAMATRTYYAFVSTTACWISQGATPTATAGAGSAFVPANTIVYVCGSDGADLAVIRDAADGKASLTRLRSF